MLPVLCIHTTIATCSVCQYLVVYLIVIDFMIAVECCDCASFFIILQTLHLLGFFVGICVQMKQPSSNLHNLATECGMLADCTSSTMIAASNESVDRCYHEEVFSDSGLVRIQIHVGDGGSGFRCR